MRLTYTFAFGARLYDLPTLAEYLQSNADPHTTTLNMEGHGTIIEDGASIMAFWVTLEFAKEADAAKFKLAAERWSTF